MENTAFTEKVMRAISDCNMLNTGDAVVAALSGGADSVSLLHALITLSGQLGISVSACHVNHCLRGDESERDMHFCEDLCASLGVELKVLKVDVAAQQHKHESLEECARRIRYAFFEEVSQGKKLATAHNSNDCAETVILNMLRGTGLKGLCGIPPVRGNIIRPLIYCTRAEVEQYCGDNSLEFVTDSTNLSCDYTRNKIRRQILPQMLDINGSLFETMSRMEKSLREDSELLENMASKALEKAQKNNGWIAAELTALPKPVRARAVKQILSSNGIEPSALRINSTLEIIEKGKGKFNPCRNRFVLIKKGVLLVEHSVQHYKKHEGLHSKE
ncbi:MAG: tRNA lysidine(34) synthetase TilS [Oscillospiraceae bacterium]